jgi:hypothetical protein
MSTVTTSDDLIKVAEMALEYIDTIPKEIADAFPAMPGFDRDWAHGVIAEAKRRSVSSQHPPKDHP